MRNTVYEFYDDTPPSQIIWNTISENGVAGLCFLPCGTTVNDPQHVEPLSNKLKMHMHDLYAERCSLPLIKSCDRLSSKKQGQGPEMVDNSPDFNQIENVLAKAKDTLAEKQSSSAKDLTRMIKEVWVKELSKEHTKNLIHSMLRRLKEVIKSGV